MKEQVLQHLTYNCWANQQLANKLEEIDEAQFTEALAGSFPSIQKTLLHIWDAEEAWITRLANIPIITWPSANFEGDKKLLIEELLATSQKLKSSIVKMNKEEFDTPILYKNMQGKEFSSSVSEIVFHVVNHGTFHRGQIINMLRAIGLQSFESMDMITFLRL